MQFSFVFFLFLFHSTFANPISNFALLDHEGRNFVLYQELEKLAENEFLILNFMSSSCIPCKKEVPELLKITEQNPKLKLVFIFMGEKDKDAFKFIEKYNMKKAYKILFDRLEISFNRLKFEGIPTTFVLKKDRTIQKILIGYNEKNIIQLQELGSEK